MKSPVTVLLVLAGAAASTLALAAFTGGNQASSARSSTASLSRVERGRYIVHGVGLCIDCHSPRGERGEFVPGRHLTGAPIEFAPTVPLPGWATAAPRIAGLPAGYSEADLAHFLNTGERPNNLPPPRPPMPPYRMNRDDAESVAAYLHSLAPDQR